MFFRVFWPRACIIVAVFAAVVGLCLLVLQVFDTDAGVSVSSGHMAKKADSGVLLLLMSQVCAFVGPFRLIDDLSSELFSLAAFATLRSIDQALHLQQISTRSVAPLLCCACALCFEHVWHAGTLPFCH